MRELLTDIGNGRSAALPFNERYTYFPTGNIQELEYRNTAPLPLEPGYKYIYNYDKANRVTETDFSLPSGFPSLYDVSNLSFDDNGNTLIFTRKKENGADIDQLSYSYTLGTNHLQSVDDTIYPTPEDTKFAYDGNGRGGNSVKRPSGHQQHSV